MVRSAATPRVSNHVATALKNALTRSMGTPAMYHFTALVTCLAILFYFYTSIHVSKARARFGVKVPAISGNPDFERVFRAQMNTLEWMPIFLPLLWLFAYYVSDRGAAILGIAWCVGRVVYIVGYSKAAAKRELGFIIQGAVCLLLLLGAVAGIVTALAHNG